MRAKLYSAVAVATRSNPETGPYNTAVMSDGFNLEADRSRWIDTMREHWNDSESETGFISNVTNIIFFRNEELIDTDDLEEYAPVYNVRIKVVKECYIEVEIDASEHDEIEDEDDAGSFVMHQCDNGDYDDQIGSEMEYADVEFEVEDIEEQS
jgi:hypothetical protein